MKKVDFFLGALAAGGFHGYFENLAARRELQLYLLQSGPGCGKSTFMKKLAQAAPWDREEIHCSSDPDSLDGVIFPARNIAIVDATAPHTLLPEAPAAAEQVVSLYHTLDSDTLQARQQRIFELLRRHACLMERASRCYTAAAGLLADHRRAAACCTDFEAVRRLAGHLSRRFLPPTGQKGREELRLLSAVTPKGLLLFRDTVTTLAGQVICLQDGPGAAARLVMELLRTDALQKGHHIITCPCPTAPDEKIDHLLLPDLGLAFVTENCWHSFDLKGQKHIRCRRFADPAMLRGCRARMNFDRRAARDLLDETVCVLQQALEVHGELEACYRSAVDFAAVDAVCARTAARMGICLPE